MYVDRVANRNSPPAVLLRESSRDGGKIIKRTLANLSHWSSRAKPFPILPLLSSSPGRSPTVMSPLFWAPFVRSAWIASSAPLLRGNATWSAP
jgi:hypothetical protein